MSEVEAWREAIARWTADEARVLTACEVVAETGSTQDVARERLAQRGAFGAITALRQTAGRGRLGRAWADTGTEGVAITLAIPDRAAESLVLLAAVAACRAIERAAREWPSGLERLGIKWPNDLVLRGRKLGGILIERPAAPRPIALVGVGINVDQRAFEGALEATATSVRLEGVSATRLAIVLGLLAECDRLLELDESDLRTQLLPEYLSRDALRGASATFTTPEGDVTGRVVEAHPFAGIAVDVEGAIRRLPTATTSVRSWRRTGLSEVSHPAPRSSR